MGELLLILISTSLANNLVLTYMLGVDPLIATSKKVGPATDTCIFMISILPIVTLVAYLSNVYFFSQFIPAYLHLILTVVVISMTVLVAGFLVEKYYPPLFQKINRIIPLMLVNSSLLGVVLLGNKYIYSLLTAIFFGLGTALGFSLILLMLVSIRKKLAGCNIPEPFQGIAILFITLGILSMGFMGLSG